MKIVREIVHDTVHTVHARARGPRTIPSCPCQATESWMRGSRTWLRCGKCHLRGGRGASTCATSVGCGSQGLGVIAPAKKRNEAHTVAASIQSTLEGATLGDTHVMPIMTGYYLILPCQGPARDFRCRTNDALPLI